MSTKYNPQTIVITGSSAGIGRATAHEFAKRGARIALFARNIDALNGAKREVEALGGKAITVVGDVVNPEDLERLAREAEERFGPIDVWVNNAMTSFLAPLKEVSVEEFRRVTDVTYHGQVYGTMVALRHMRPRNYGKIVFVGSALAYRGIPLQTAYCGAKHATLGFFESLRTELLHEGSDISTTMVQLPGINTTQFSLTRNKMPNKARPMGAMYEPEVAARAIVYAADSDEREVYVGLPAFQTIWGNKLLPGVVDNVLASTGYAGQQTDDPADPNAPDYLFEPVPGDHGYKGGFQAQARSASPALWAVMHKWAGAALVAGAAAASTAALLLLSDDSDDGRGGGRYGQRRSPDSDSRATKDDIFRSRSGNAKAGQPRYIDHTVYPEDDSRTPAAANPRDAKASTADSTYPPGAAFASTDGRAASYPLGASAEDGSEQYDSNYPPRPRGANPRSSLTQTQPGATEQRDRYAYKEGQATDPEEYTQTRLPGEKGRTSNL